MNEINPMVYFGQRELPFVPRHFVRASTPLTTQSLFWVKTRLTGRYSYLYDVKNTVIFHDLLIIYFENPAELTMYELRWAGTNIL